MTRLAIVSSIGVPMKTIRSLRRREKMSYARSPRPVCSTTIGTSWLYTVGERHGVLSLLCVIECTCGA